MKTSLTATLEHLHNLGLVNEVQRDLIEAELEQGRDAP